MLKTMLKTRKCPVCDNKGDMSDENLFEVRGQLEGWPVRKCLKCGSGLVIRIVRKPRVIDPDFWKKMEALWNKSFG